MRVAAVQTIVSRSVEVNTKKIVRYIAQAASKGCDIVCFCETTLDAAIKRRDVKQNIKFIKEACKQHNIWCIFGAYVPYRSKVKNKTFLIDRKGKEVYVYDKVHLWNSEVGKVVPGVHNEVVQTEFGPIGLINCWDFAFPEDIRKLSSMGARVIFCPSYLVEYGKDGPALHKLPLVRAFENLAYYITVDAFDKRTLSESYICHPTKILKRIKGKEGMVVADLDLGEIDELRVFYNHV